MPVPRFLKRRKGRAGCIFKGFPLFRICIFSKTAFQFSGKSFSIFGKMFFHFRKNMFSGFGKLIFRFWKKKNPVQEKIFSSSGKNIFHFWRFVTRFRGLSSVGVLLGKLIPANGPPAVSSVGVFLEAKRRQTGRGRPGRN